MKHISSLLAVLTCFLAAPASAAELPAAPAAPAPREEQPALATGAPAPLLHVEKWLDGAAPFQVGQGRAGVLVFWATWCGSCIAEFAHLNALVAELADQPLTFVSISDEPHAKVAEMLAARPLKTRVALDDDGKTFTAYGVRVLPRIVLVDAHGNVAALPRSQDLDASVLRELVAGKVLDLPEARSEPADVDWDQGKASLDATRSLAHAWIERSSAASGAVHFPPEHGRITADGVGFANLVQVAYGAESHQVLSTHPGYEDFERLYRVSIQAHDNRAETARAMLREQLVRLFPHRAEWIEVEAPTAVLRRLPGRELSGLRPSRATESSGLARNGSIHFVKVPIERIVAALGTYGLGGALVDETGLTGDCDLDLDWTPGSAAQFAAALGASGLEYVTEPRQMRQLRLGPAQ